MNTQIIINRMNELGLNYRTLAAKAGVGCKTLQNAIEGHDIILFFDTMRVARFLGLSLDDVLLEGKASAERNLSELVTRYCVTKNWELPDFAEAAGLNAGNLRGIVAGSQKPSNGEAAKIAELVGISMDELARVCVGEVSVDDVIKAKGAGNE